MLGSSGSSRAGLPPERPRLPDEAGAVHAMPEPVRRGMPSPALRPPGTPVLAALTAWVQSLLWEDEEDAPAELPIDAPDLSADGGLFVPAHRPVASESGSQGEGGDAHGGAADAAQALLRRASHPGPREEASRRPAGDVHGARVDGAGLRCWRAAYDAPPLVTDPGATAEVADLRGSRRRIEPVRPMASVRRRRSTLGMVLRIAGSGFAAAVAAVLVSVIALALPSPDTSSSDGGRAPRHPHRQAR